METVSSRQFKIKACQYLEGVRQKGWCLTVKYHDTPFAVVLPLARYLELAEAEEAAQNTLKRFLNRFCRLSS